MLYATNQIFSPEGRHASSGQLFCTTINVFPYSITHVVGTPFYRVIKAEDRVDSCVFGNFQGTAVAVAWRVGFAALSAVFNEAYCMDDLPCDKKLSFFHMSGTTCLYAFGSIIMATSNCLTERLSQRTDNGSAPMDTITYTATRTNLVATMDRVCNDHEAIIITRKSDQAVVMISLEEYKALEETAYLLRTPANAGRLSAVARLDAGKGVERKLAE